MTTFQRQTVAIVCAAGLHLAVLIAAVVLAMALSARPGWSSASPTQPFLVIAVGFVLAQVSVGAVWWARSNWHITARTVAALLSCGVLWLLLVRLLYSTRTSGLAATAWAAALLVQTALIGLAAAGLEFWLDYRAATARNRFSLTFLLIFTTIVAAVLGGAGDWSARAGWKIADVPAWEYFWQLQAVAVLSACLALLALASLRGTGSPAGQALLLLGVVAAMAWLAPVTLHGIFGQRAGVTPVTLVWLFTAQGLFLAASLWPMEVARARYRSGMAADASGQ